MAIAPSATGTTAHTEALPPAIQQAYDAHAPSLFRVLRRLGVPDAQVEDAVQDTFVVACRRHAAFEARSSYKTWLYGIARRVARDYRRQRARRYSEDPEIEGLSGGTNPETQTDAARAARLLDAGLGRLSEPLREVFVLAEIEQLTAPEIAEVVQVPLNTVYSRLRVARERLGAYLTEQRATGGSV